MQSAFGEFKPVFNEFGSIVQLNQVVLRDDEKASRSTGDDGQQGRQESVMLRTKWRASTKKASTGMTEDFAELMRALKALVDPYRPEEHYMRGPGPKWHAKHDPALDPQDTATVPGLVRVKA